MGCGTGVGRAVGEAGHKVVAADFSQGMLDQMQRPNEAGVRTVFQAHELRTTGRPSACARA
ncbi:MAG: hypothetical protein ACLUYK_01360 [Eggerthella lenta]